MIDTNFDFYTNESITYTDAHTVATKIGKALGYDEKKIKIDISLIKFNIIFDKEYFVLDKVVDVINHSIIIGVDRCLIEYPEVIRVWNKLISNIDSNEE